jgi:hypothetical protein
MVNAAVSAPCQALVEGFYPFRDDSLIAVMTSAKVSPKVSPKDVMKIKMGRVFDLAH